MASLPAVYRSRQFGYEQPILALTIVGCIAAMVVVAALTDQTQGEWIAILLGSVVMLGMGLIPLTVTVTREHVEARLAGIFSAPVPMSDIASAEVRDYKPLRDFGGWGWRFGRNGARQYALAGKRAVVVTRIDGREVYLGARDLEGLADAIGQARSHPR